MKTTTHEKPEITIQPVEIDQVTLAFPANLGGIIPPMEDIPDFYKDMNNRYWSLALGDKWFFTGLHAGDMPSPREGLKNTENAWRQLKTIQSSFEPKHEHKRAAIGYLIDMWFDEK